MAIPLLHYITDFTMEIKSLKSISVKPFQERRMASDFLFLLKPMASRT